MYSQGAVMLLAFMHVYQHYSFLKLKMYFLSIPKRYASPSPSPFFAQKYKGRVLCRHHDMKIYTAHSTYS